MGDGAEKYAGQKRWRRDVADIRRIAERPAVGSAAKIQGHEVRFDTHMIDDLLRRREYGTEIDGMRGIAYDGAAGGGHSESSPVEAAALAGLPEADEDAEVNGREVKPDDWRNHIRPDPVGRQLEACLDHLSEAARHLRKFERLAAVVFNADALAKERQPLTEKCLVCERPVAGNDRDLLHRGRYCTACNSAWKRAGRPHDLEELQWAERRRQALEADGKLWSQSGHTFTSADGSTYRVEELDDLVASGTLPARSAS